MLVVDKPDLKICRMNTSQREGNVSILHFHYLIGTPDGVRRVEELHRLALISVEQLTAYFAQAGLEARFDPTGPSGRGLFVARRVDPRA
jgi:hypothetical protein